ncbi:polysaccharide pyruvyl transferase family protein [Oryzicola mucosus]|uniref:Polysaccharide pyruvyl transferase family protein n=1 Tax=Oryzicola mucosus TaxID=2767425 RepID=A0A8J6PUL4_9HYPH|nr:polysaccharide pyruvyl transferase family protein [Oryzicola mucosus]MBD0415994.1 polysaccharide pyruvyl transferase family protein [Oryzicola mucosus]
MTSVSIIAATFYGNRGAEGMLSTTIGMLRRHAGEDLTFNVFTYYPERDRELVADQRVSMYSSTPAYLVAVLFPFALLYRFLGFFRLRPLQRMLPKSVQALAASSMLVCLAGVSFVGGRTKFIPFNIATILPAMVLGVPVVKFAQALGPFNEPLNRLAAKIFLPWCNHVFTRGEKTQAHMKEVFPNKTFYERADDCAFLFEKSFCISAPAPGGLDGLATLDQHRAAGRTIVGVCPSIVVALRAKASGWDYAALMRDLLSGLVAKGYAVALFPNATRGEDMDKTHNNDLPLLLEIYEGLDAETRKYCVSFSGSLNIAQIHQIIEASDVVAVSRFHAMVGALAAGTPVMVIGWSHKYLEVMQRFQQEDMVLDYKRGEIGVVVGRIEQLVAEKASRKATITASFPAVQALSMRQIEYSAKLVKGRRA